MEESQLISRTKSLVTRLDLAMLAVPSLYLGSMFEYGRASIPGASEDAVALENFSGEFSDEIASNMIAPEMAPRGS